MQDFGSGDPSSNLGGGILTKSQIRNATLFKTSQKSRRHPEHHTGKVDDPARLDPWRFAEHSMVDTIQKPGSLLLIA